MTKESLLLSRFMVAMVAATMTGCSFPTWASSGYTTSSASSDYAPSPARSVALGTRFNWTVKNDSPYKIGESTPVAGCMKTVPFHPDIRPGAEIKGTLETDAGTFPWDTCFYAPSFFETIFVAVDPQTRAAYHNTVVWTGFGSAAGLFVLGHRQVYSGGRFPICAYVTAPAPEPRRYQPITVHFLPRFARDDGKHCVDK
jgi:hypothetical protein